MSPLSKCARVVAAAAGLWAPSALAAPVPLSDAQLGAAPAGIAFNVLNRVSDQPGVAALTDPNLVNAWGLSQGPGTFLWVSNNGSNTSTLYNPTTFAKAPLVVSVPGAPTGTTFIGINNAFDVSQGGKVGNTLFAFATEGGQIEGWSPAVNVNNAIVAFDGAAKGDEFKGLTLGEAFTAQGFVPRLFATDFGQNTVDVFNSKFQVTGHLTDPFLPRGYSPFNAQNLNGLIYVTYAQRAPGAHDETAGPGLGIVDVFTPNGFLARRLVTGGPLNAPWGLAMAPLNWGKFAGALLVGNFGDGKINAFNPLTGDFIGQLNLHEKDNSIDGLWALTNGPNGTITFSAGPDDENHGLLGSIARAGPQLWGGAEVVGMAEMAHH